MKMISDFRFWILDPPIDGLPVPPVTNELVGIINCSFYGLVALHDLDLTREYCLKSKMENPKIRSG